MHHIAEYYSEKSRTCKILDRKPRISKLLTEHWCRPWTHTNLTRPGRGTAMSKKLKSRILLWARPDGVDLSGAVIQCSISNRILASGRGSAFCLSGPLFGLRVWHDSYRELCYEVTALQRNLRLSSIDGDEIRTLFTVFSTSKSVKFDAQL